MSSAPSSSLSPPPLSLSSVSSEWTEFHGEVDKHWENIYSKNICNTVEYLKETLMGQYAKETFVFTPHLSRSREDIWRSAVRTAIALRPICPFSDEKNSEGGGRRVAALLCRNSIEFLSTWMGLALLGFSVALLNTANPLDALRRDCKTVKTQIIIADGKFTEIAMNLKSSENLPTVIIDSLPSLSSSFPLPSEDPKGKTFYLSELISSVSPKEISDFLPPPIVKSLRLDDPLFFIFTSGTTGNSKGALFSHRRFIGCGVVWTAAMKLNSSDCFYNSLPLFHGNGGCVALSAVLLSGGKMFLREKFSVKSFWGEIESFGCTAMIYIGEIWRYLINKGGNIPQSMGKSLRVIAGNGLTVPTWKNILSEFPSIHRIVEHYGMTEMPAGPHINFYGRIGACGFVPSLSADSAFRDTLRPLKIRADKIIQFDLQSNSPKRNSKGFAIEVTTPGEVGECVFLLARGKEFAAPKNSPSPLNPNSAENPHVPLDLISPFGADPLGNPSYVPYNGYSDPSQCSSRVYRSLFEDGDAFFSTGDLLKFDSDGFLYFVDRAGDSFRHKGENISSTDVQSALSEFNASPLRLPLCPQISDCAVVGVKMGNREGKVGLAALTIDGDFSDFSPHFGRFIEFLLQRMPKVAIPTFFRFSQKNQKTTETHKIQKFTLQKENFNPKNIQNEEGDTQTLIIIQPKRLGNPQEKPFRHVDDALYSMIIQSEYSEHEF